MDRSLMRGDNVVEGGKGKPMHSDTEIAGMCSHWELMRRQSQQDERFLVLEHDTWYKGGSTRYFKQLIDMDVFYLNIGLFMGCYAFDRRTAEHQYHMMVNGFPINCRSRTVFSIDYSKPIQHHIWNKTISITNLLLRYIHITIAIL